MDIKDIKVGELYKFICMDIKNNRKKKKFCIVKVERIDERGPYPINVTIIMADRYHLELGWIPNGSNDNPCNPHELEEL